MLQNLYVYDLSPYNISNDSLTTAIKWKSKYRFWMTTVLLIFYKKFSKKLHIFPIFSHKISKPYIKWLHCSDLRSLHSHCVSTTDGRKLKSKNIRQHLLACCSYQVLWKYIYWFKSYWETTYQIWWYYKPIISYKIRRVISDCNGE
jgi:hypothetical protein